MRVCILGGGINGFSSALRVLEYLRTVCPDGTFEVNVLSDRFTPNTTGDGSAGLWGPYLLGSTEPARVFKWSQETHKFLEKLWLSEDAAETGVCLLPVERLTTNPEPIVDFWREIVYGCRPLSQSRLDHYNRNRDKKFTSGLHFVTYTSEPAKLLPYLMKRFKELGGNLIEGKVDKLNTFLAQNDYQVVINCMGLGCREALNDPEMYPIRGQVSRIRAPWMNHVILDESDDGNYVIPNTETVVLGGTHQEHDYNLDISCKDRHFIMEGCHQLKPGLVHAQHLYDWVGLRPGRSSVRLEAEIRDKTVVIHNYGHGGSGVTLAWGCAGEVVELLDSIMRKQLQHQPSQLTKSKL